MLPDAVAQFATIITIYMLTNPEYHDPLRMITLWQRNSFWLCLPFVSRYNNKVLILWGKVFGVNNEIKLQCTSCGSAPEQQYAQNIIPRLRTSIGISNLGFMIRGQFQLGCSSPLSQHPEFEFLSQSGFAKFPRTNRDCHIRDNPNKLAPCFLDITTTNRGFDTMHTIILKPMQIVVHQTALDFWIRNITSKMRTRALLWGQCYCTKIWRNFLKNVLHCAMLI